MLTMNLPFPSRKPRSNALLQIFLSRHSQKNFFKYIFRFRDYESTFLVGVAFSYCLRLYAANKRSLHS